MPAPGGAGTPALNTPFRYSLDFSALFICTGFSYIAVGWGKQVKVCAWYEAGQEVAALVKPGTQIEAGWFYPIGQLVDEVHQLSLRRTTKPKDP